MGMNEIAKTIYAQMGGNMAMTMIGASHLGYGDNFLQLRFKGAKGMNSLRVTLAGDDTYTLEFYNIKKIDFKLVKSVESGYADSLQQVFTAETGLYTRV
jgi:hypothetical protein